MSEVLVPAFGYTVAVRYLDNSEEMVRDRYSHIEAGELVMPRRKHLTRTTAALESIKGVLSKYSVDDIFQPITSD